MREIAKIQLAALTEYAKRLEKVRRPDSPYLHDELFRIARIKARIIKDKLRGAE